MDSSHDLHLMRHSGAHLLAAAIASLWPKTKLGGGPATDLGFFYDIAASPPITEADFPRIEARVDELRAAALPFVCERVAIEHAIELMRSLDQPYKLELLELLKS